VPEATSFYDPHHDTVFIGQNGQIAVHGERRDQFQLRLAVLGDVLEFPTEGIGFTPPSNLVGVVPNYLALTSVSCRSEEANGGTQAFRLQIQNPPETEEAMFSETVPFRIPTQALKLGIWPGSVTKQAMTISGFMGETGVSAQIDEAGFKNGQFSALSASGEPMQIGSMEKGDGAQLFKAGNAMQIIYHLRPASDAPTQNGMPAAVIIGQSDNDAPGEIYQQWLSQTVNSSEGR
jgi:hypothetical protein